MKQPTIKSNLYIRLKGGDVWPVVSVRHEGRFLSVRYIDSSESLAITPLEILFVPREDRRLNESRLLVMPETEPKPVEYAMPCNYDILPIRGFALGVDAA